MVVAVALRLAVRCQHLRRWTIPRSQYPMTRAGLANLDLTKTAAENNLRKKLQERAKTSRTGDLKRG